MTSEEKLKLAVIEERIMSRQDEFGREVPDGEPLALPSGFKRPETLAEQVARLVQGSLSRLAQESGEESFEESEDFDVEDDFDPRTPYEEIFDPTLGRSITPLEMQKNGDRYKEMYLAAERNRYRAFDRARRLAGVADAAPVDTRRDVPAPAPAPTPPVDQ